MLASTESATGSAAIEPRCGEALARWLCAPSQDPIALGTSPFAGEQRPESRDARGFRARPLAFVPRPGERVRAALRPIEASPRAGLACLPWNRRISELDGSRSRRDPTAHRTTIFPRPLPTEGRAGASPPDRSPSSPPSLLERDRPRSASPWRRETRPTPLLPSEEGRWGAASWTDDGPVRGAGGFEDPVNLD